MLIFKGGQLLAVTGPTPPIPPNAPVVPKVVLGGDAAVESSTPPQKPTAEEQAKEAVARGDGTLAKTTTEPVKAQKEKSASEPAKEKPAAETSVAGNHTNTQVVRAPETPKENESMQRKEMTAQDIPASPAHHGMLYWGASILSLIVLGIVFYKVFLKKKRGKGFEDFPSLRVEKSKMARAVKKPAEEAAKTPTAPPASSTQPAKKAYLQQTEQEGKRATPTKSKKREGMQEDGHFEVRI